MIKIPSGRRKVHCEECNPPRKRLTKDEGTPWDNPGFWNAYKRCRRGTLSRGEFERICRSHGWRIPHVSHKGGKGGDDFCIPKGFSL